MTKKKMPYIGITDFETPAQVQQMLDVFEKLSEGKQKRLLMIGIMMNYKTLHGLKTSWAGAWPANETVGQFFLPHPLALNTLHYADFEPQTTVDDLMKALQYANSKKGLDCIQFDMVWPGYNVIAEMNDAFYLEHGKTIRSVLQVGSIAMQQCDYDLYRIVHKIGRYRGVVDYILLDLSGGKGEKMNPDLIRNYIREIKDHYGDDFGIAVAGGLGPDTMDLIEPLLGEFPDLSIDAQGRLHIDNESKKPSDPKKQEKYLRAAVPMFP